MWLLYLIWYFFAGKSVHSRVPRYTVRWRYFGGSGRYIYRQWIYLKVKIVPLGHLCSTPLYRWQCFKSLNIHDTLRKISNGKSIIKSYYYIIAKSVCLLPNFTKKSWKKPCPLGILLKGANPLAILLTVFTNFFFRASRGILNTLWEASLSVKKPLSDDHYPQKTFRNKRAVPQCTLREWVF